MNDKRFIGPDLLQSLVGIVFRFREREFALTVDKKGIFLQVQVPQKACRVLRFLCRSKPDDRVGVYDYIGYALEAFQLVLTKKSSLPTGVDNKEGHPNI